MASAMAIDYNQPEISPYEQSRIIVITVGNKNYSIPENYIQGHLLQTRQYRNSRIILEDINADIGHTILHFLYKGEYETIADREIHPDTSRVELEYKRSVQVYYAARKYEIHGLETLAQNYIESLSESLSVFQILQGARMIFSRLSEDETWFHDYLHSKLSSSFANDETIFQLDEFYNEIVDDPVLSKAVMRIVVTAFTTKLSRLRNLLEPPSSRNEINKEPGKAFCEEPFPEPEFEPAEEYYGKSCPEVPSEQPCVMEALPAPDEECPCEEPPIEVVPVESKEATPKVHDDWGFASSQAKGISLSNKELHRLKRRMQKRAERETLA
ncbi:hypothetical protein BDW59DRAFT_174159 [Aspergillus cavernicola]|uniref:BTB domain-containing protein n=1 Tax=Aspergillus cavernicola TaxID=176166 RepID=A0ABR4I124_9EURO